MSGDRNTSLIYNNQPNQSTAGTGEKKGGWARGGVVNVESCKNKKVNISPKGITRLNIIQVIE